RIRPKHEPSTPRLLFARSARVEVDEGVRHPDLLLLPNRLGDERSRSRKRRVEPRSRAGAQTRRVGTPRPCGAGPAFADARAATPRTAASRKTRTVPSPGGVVASFEPVTHACMLGEAGRPLRPSRVDVP